MGTLVEAIFQGGRGSCNLEQKAVTARGSNKGVLRYRRASPFRRLGGQPMQDEGRLMSPKALLHPRRVPSFILFQSATS